MDNNEIIGEMNNANYIYHYEPQITKNQANIMDKGDNSFIIITIRKENFRFVIC